MAKRRARKLHRRRSRGGALRQQGAQLEWGKTPLGGHPNLVAIELPNGTLIQIPSQ